ncbi:MAG: sugar phosphate isomerase/epimerase [Clostridia bacterium]|nr:sugar phosphate isomerase/epimerase [Clostridia bacterium]
MNPLGINYYWDYEKKYGLKREEFCSLIAGIGFDGFFSVWRDRAETALFADCAARYGLCYSSLHAPYAAVNEMWLPGDAGNAVLAEFCESLSDAADNGIPVVVMHMSSGDAAPPITDIGRDRYEKLVNFAVRKGITLAFENQRKLANLAYMFETYADVPNVRFCWDMGHESALGPGFAYMPMFGPKAVYTHIHDNFCVHNGDIHLIPFDGGIDYSARVRHLAENGYTGPLTLELSGPRPEYYEGLSNEAYLHRAFDALNKLRNMLQDEREKAL